MRHLDLEKYAPSYLNILLCFGRAVQSQRCVNSIPYAYYIPKNTHNQPNIITSHSQFPESPLEKLAINIPPMCFSFDGTRIMYLKVMVL